MRSARPTRHGCTFLVTLTKPASRELLRIGASAEKLKNATSSGMSKSWRWQEIMGGLAY
jgi:hypothetical protein